MHLLNRPVLGCVLVIFTVCFLGLAHIFETVFEMYCKCNVIIL